MIESQSVSEENGILLLLHYKTNTNTKLGIVPKEGQIHITQKSKDCVYGCKFNSGKYIALS